MLIIALSLVGVVEPARKRATRIPAQRRHDGRETSRGGGEHEWGLPAGLAQDFGATPRLQNLT